MMRLKMSCAMHGCEAAETPLPWRGAVGLIPALLFLMKPYPPSVRFAAFLRFRLLATALSGWLLSAPIIAGDPPRQNSETRQTKLHLNLLPRSLQKNPLVDLTVITELTPEGKKLPAPSPARPVFYVAQSVGRHAEGQGPKDRHLPKEEELAVSLQRALAVNGYLPATPAHPPTLLIVYHWGAHTNLESGSQEEGDIGIPDLDHKNLLSRAALVGGTQFAEELRQALEKQDLEDQTHALSVPPSGIPSDDVSEMLKAMAVIIGRTGPLAKFIERDTKTAQLFDAARADCYYAVASAYDYASASRGQRRLLWRSKMTVDSQAVAMSDTLPGLILNAGKYLGVDMPEAATLSKRALGEGSVKLGPLQFENPPEPPATPPTNKQHP